MSTILACSAGVPVRFRQSLLGEKEWGEHKAAAGEGEQLKNGEGKGGEGNVPSPPPSPPQLFACHKQERLQCWLVWMCQLGWSCFSNLTLYHFIIWSQALDDSIMWHWFWSASCKCSMKIYIHVEHATVAHFYAGKVITGTCAMIPPFCFASG